MAVPLTVAGRVFYPLGFTRCITTSAVLSGRGIRSVVKGLGLREEELEDIGPDELEAMSYPSYDTFNRVAAQIEGDAKRYQAHLRHKTIQHKYFKSWNTNEENLLTWSMKEQLKYLHSSDPAQWTPDVLSKSFPISPEGVVRLVKTHWVPKSETERQKHDQAVVARWKKHMRGEIGSLQILEKALNNKFSPETLPSPVMGTEQVLNILEGLHFDGEKPYDEWNHAHQSTGMVDRPQQERIPQTY
ncbi:Neugrin [Chionoecetes opilio]|uniref:Neugrin n=1 Tax=Chionoecetes opilio TaxID=41210 RepID=A0A8J4YLM2_CHIOP|nr:Neugrin [Chionoecetes opilio]